MSKLAAISSTPLVREYAQGVAQTTVSPVAEFLAPTVPVGTMHGRFKKYDEKHRFRIPDTRRALGGRATELGFTAADASYNCTPHALDFPVDYLEELEDDGLINVMKEGADMIAQTAALAHEQTVVALALETLGAGTPLDMGANDDVLKQLDKIALDILRRANFGGMMEIGFLFGAGAALEIRHNKSVMGRFVSGGGSKFNIPTMDDIASMLLVNAKTQVTLLCADAAPEGLDADPQFLLNGDILVFARMQSPSRRDPSFMKTFRLRDNWMVPGSYTRDDGRVEVAKYDWSCDVQVANTIAGQRLSVALS